ncbi:MAG TPA: flagellar hook-basal body complex protein FliE [Ferroplasma sp.]|jgi:dephospho-CoA kinase|nr:flagellar hook-basal body complex protein FliE [Ferroplasma sp.]
MLIITGMPGSGKDEFVKVAKSMGFIDAHMGNAVKKNALKNNINLDDKSVGTYATAERKKYGMDIWAKRTAELITNPDITIVDGLRNEEELDYFKNNFHNIIVIAVFANETDRLERILARDREDDSHDYSGMHQRDNRELSWGIGKVISLADYMIVNDSTLEEYHKNVNILLKHIISRHPEINLQSGH